MIDLLTKIKPILDEIDATYHWDGLVDTKSYISLFEKHSPIKNILTHRHNFEGIDSLFLQTEKCAIISHKACFICDDTDFKQDCIECQKARFCIVKELVHCFDGDDQKTNYQQYLEHVFHKLSLEEDHPKGTPVYIDALANTAAIELLVRYKTRYEFLRTPSFEFAQLIKANDFSRIANMFAIPEENAKRAFDPKYHNLMKTYRTQAGLKIEWGYSE